MVHEGGGGVKNSPHGLWTLDNPLTKMSHIKKGEDKYVMGVKSLKYV